MSEPKRPMEEWNSFVGSMGNTLARWTGAVGEYGVERWQALIGKVFNPPTEERKKEGKEADLLAWDELEREFKLEGADFAPIRHAMEEAAEGPWWWGWLTRIFVGAYATSTKLTAWYSGLGNLLQQRVNRQLRPNPVGMDVIGRWMMMNGDPKGAASDLFDRLGIPNAQQVMYLEAMRQFPALAEMLILVNRKIMTEDDAVDYMTRQGMTPDDAAKVIQLRHWHPAPSDLIMLAGREAFEEEAIRRFRLDQDLEEIDPAPFLKAGMSKEQMRWYWVAHWSNPSINQVFEMIHRKVRKPGPNGEPGGGGVFTLEDLEVYYRVADINPFFGDLLRQIAYRPLPRVDIRRMRQLGVLDRPAVKDAYGALGYSPEHSEMMTEFTERLVKGGAKNLTRAQITSVYKQGRMTAADYRSQLVDMGYDEEEAATIQELTDSELEVKRNADNIRAIGAEYKRKRIGRAEANAELNRLDLPALKIGDLLDQWDNEAIYSRKIPSRENVTEWAESGAIDRLEFRAMMRDLMYTDEVIGLYEGGISWPT